MSKPTKQKKSVRKQYAPEFRTEALTLAGRVGIPEAAKQLGIDSQLIYNWRNARRLTQTSAEAEALLATENARLKRQLAEQAEELAILKKAAAYFAKHQK
jgi:transposase